MKLFLLLFLLESVIMAASPVLANLHIYRMLRVFINLDHGVTTYSDKCEASHNFLKESLGALWSVWLTSSGRGPTASLWKTAGVHRTASATSVARTMACAVKGLV